MKRDQVKESMILLEEHLKTPFKSKERKKRKPGDRYEETKRGITWLMETQVKGRAKIVDRITPYKDKSKANSRSTLPQTKGKVPNPRNRKVKVISSDAPLKLEGEKFDDGKLVKVRIDSKTVVWRKKANL